MVNVNQVEEEIVCHVLGSFVVTFCTGRRDLNSVGFVERAAERIVNHYWAGTYDVETLLGEYVQPLSDEATSRSFATINQTAYTLTIPPSLAIELGGDCAPPYHDKVIFLFSNYC